MTNETSDLFIAASKQAAKNGYGQNGYQGASSDLPGQHTASGFLPAATVPGDDWQTRKVSAEQKVATHPGMKAPAAPAKVPSHTTYRAAAPAKNRSFQR